MTDSVPNRSIPDRSVERSGTTGYSITVKVKEAVWVELEPLDDVLEAVVLVTTETTCAPAGV